jgi:hypothetical protein
MNKTPEKILDDAIWLLENRGWTKGEFMDDNGCYCVVGAVRSASEVDDDDEPLFGPGRLVQDALWLSLRSLLREDDELRFRIHHDNQIGVISFNDAEDTTFEDIKKLLDNAHRYL